MAQLFLFSSQVLTNASFKTQVRDLRSKGAPACAAMASKRADRLQRLQEITKDLIMAWGLSALCMIGHVAHAWQAAPQWMHLLHAPPVAAMLSALALLGQLPNIFVPSTIGILVTNVFLNRLGFTKC